MAATRKTPESSRKRRPPATTPEAREKQMIVLAVDLAEKQLIEGTASSTVINHYLKLATVREDLERDKLKNENELLKAKINSLGSEEDTKIMYEEALRAMRQYSGQEVYEDDED